MLSAAALLAAYVPLGPSTAQPHARLLPSRRCPHAPRASVDLDKQWSRAEFWTDEKATTLDLINVLGRWSSSSQWAERTEFVSEGSFNYREETILQGLTEKRYNMARKLGQVERAAFFINVPKIPFTDARLAASVGKTVEDFEKMPPPSISHCNVVYDALAESKSGLIPPAVVDARRNGLFTADGALDEGAFASGLFKSRSIVIASWFLFGKGQILGLIVGIKVVLVDSLNLGDKLNVPDAVLNAVTLLAVVGAAVYAALAQANDTAAAMEALEQYEEQAKAKAMAAQQAAGAAQQTA